MKCPTCGKLMKEGRYTDSVVSEPVYVCRRCMVTVSMTFNPSIDGTYPERTYPSSVL